MKQARSERARYAYLIMIEMIRLSVKIELRGKVIVNTYTLREDRRIRGKP